MAMHQDLQERISESILMPESLLIMNAVLLEEAKEKIALGMKVLIREGSAARNLDSLKELFNLYPEMIMLCSDDLHPEMLVERHINKLIGKLDYRGI